MARRSGATCTIIPDETATWDRAIVGPRPRLNFLSGLRGRRRKALASSEERKRTFSVFAKPFRTVISLVLGLIGVIPRAIERR